MISPLLYIPLVFFSLIANSKDINHRDIQRCVTDQRSSKQNYGVPTKELEEYCVCAVNLIDNEQVKNVTDLKLKISKNCFLNQNEYTKELEKELRFISDETNKKLPMQIDEFVIYTGTTSGPRKRFNHFYSLIKHKKSDLDGMTFDGMSFESKIKLAYTNIFCTDPSYEYFRLKNIENFYHINDVEGKFVTRLVVTPDMCKSNGKN